MYEFLKSVYALYVSPSGANLRALVNGLYPDEAPQGITTPYITYSLISSIIDWTMSSSEIQQPLLQFSIWDDDPAPDNVLAAGAQIEALYTDNLIAVSGFHTVRADKIGDRLLRDPDDKGWSYNLEYRYYLQTT